MVAAQRWHSLDKVTLTEGLTLRKDPGPKATPNSNLVNVGLGKFEVQGESLVCFNRYSRIMKFDSAFLISGAQPFLL